MLSASLNKTFPSFLPSLVTRVNTNLELELLSIEGRVVRVSDSAADRRAVLVFTVPPAALAHTANSEIVNNTLQLRFNSGNYKRKQLSECYMGADYAM